MKTLRVDDICLSGTGWMSKFPGESSCWLDRHALRNWQDRCCFLLQSPKFWLVPLLGKTQLTLCWAKEEEEPDVLDGWEHQVTGQEVQLRQVTTNIYLGSLWREQ